MLAGEETPHHFGDGDDWDAGFRDATPDLPSIAEAWSSWREEVGFAERFVDSCPDLDRTGIMGDGQPVSLRAVLVHMIEEYARHCGHADLIRERIDGRVGQ